MVRHFEILDRKLNDLTPRFDTDTYDIHIEVRTSTKKHGHTVTFQVGAVMKAYTIKLCTKQGMSPKQKILKTKQEKEENKREKERREEKRREEKRREEMR